MGFHVCQLIWMPVMSEELPCECEYYIEHNHIAVAVKKDDVIVGHLPRMHSATFQLFLRSDSIRSIVRSHVLLD